MNEQETENIHNMRKTYIKAAIRAGSFLLILCLLLSSVYKTLVFRKDTATFNWIRGMYEERENSLDAVCIGASSCYRAWIAPVAWNNYGIAVWPFFNASQPVEAAEYLVKEARKKQPNALMIISINLLWSNFNEEQLHNTVDFLPISENRIKLTKELIMLGDYPKEEKNEFYFPLIRFHSRWNELTEEDFHYSINGQKGGLTNKSLFQSVQDVSDSYRNTVRRTELIERIQNALENLLDYCDAESVKVLFIITPQVGPDETWLAMYNSANDYITARGYPVLNMRADMDRTGIDLTRDYYDPDHTNAHGAFKLTDYLAKYLVKNYGLKDKRGDPAYADWNEAYELYTKSAARYGCDYEWNGSKRDYSLTAPKLTKLTVDGSTLTLTWDPVVNADGYCIYRKSADGFFAPIADMDADTLNYVDTECKVGEQYTYTVVSFVEKEGTRYWGTYDFKGLSATAAMNAPSAPELSGSEDNLTLAWNGVKGADGYQIERRVFGKFWVSMGEVTDKTTYTDTNMLENMPYQYRIRAYWLNEAGEKVYGSYSMDSFWLPDLTSPEVKAKSLNGVPTLKWTTIEGITGYTVSRKAAGGNWEQIADPLAADYTQFQDFTAQCGTEYVYQVSAYLTYGKETYRYPSEEVRVTAEAEPIQLAVPELRFAEEVGDGDNIQLVWESSENATAYRVYRRADGEDSWTVVKAFVDGNTYQEKPPESGTYSYALQPLYMKDGCTYYGDFPESAGRKITYSQ